MSEPITTTSQMFRVNNNITSYKFSIPSIPISTEEEVILPVNKKGVITGIRIVTNSTDYTVSLRTEASLTTPSINEILKIEDINISYNELQLLIPYINNSEDPEDFLYLVVTNDDSSNATGIFDLELIISIN